MYFQPDLQKNILVASNKTRTGNGSYNQRKVNQKIVEVSTSRARLNKL